MKTRIRNGAYPDNPFPGQPNVPMYHVHTYTRLYWHDDRHPYRPTEKKANLHKQAGKGMQGNIEAVFLLNDREDV